MYFWQKLKNKTSVKKYFFDLKALFLKYNPKHSLTMLQTKPKYDVCNAINLGKYLAEPEFPSKISQEINFSQYFISIITIYK